jgi:predicted hotdog family 3-hydroxylacyl-ACP dehydratase
MLDAIDYTKLIPHRPPFVMVDKIIEANDDCFKTSFHIKESNILTRNGYFSEAGIIENIAQSIAISRGYHHLKEGNLPKIGYIGSIKNLTIHTLPKVNTEIVTEIIITHELLHFTSVHGKSYQNNIVLATCDLTIATQN